MSGIFWYDSHDLSLSGTIAMILIRLLLSGLIANNIIVWYDKHSLVYQDISCHHNFHWMTGTEYSNKDIRLNSMPLTVCISGILALWWPALPVIVSVSERLLIASISYCQHSLTWWPPHHHHLSYHPSSSWSFYKLWSGHCSEAGITGLYDKSWKYRSQQRWGRWWWRRGWW